VGTEGGTPGAEKGHVHVAPHGGALIVLGDEFAHVELVFDPASGRAEAHVLDGHAQKGVPIDAMELRFAAEGVAVPLILLPVASALSGEEAGRTSRFAGSWPELAGREAFAATLESVRVRGTDFRSVAFRFPEGNEGAGATGPDGRDGHDSHDSPEGHDGHDH
jgi:hypothetical protein